MIFGITGDLARKMTYDALYDLELHGTLQVPVIGVAIDELTRSELLKRMRESCEAAEKPFDEEVFKRLAERITYIQGDYKDPKTFEAVAKELKGAEHPVFYLEIPPSLFALVVEGLANAGLTEGARVVIEKPFGHDLESAKALNAELGKHLDRAADLPDRPLPRQGAGDGHPLPALRQHRVRADLEPALRQLGADHDGRELRGRRPRQLLRPGRARCGTSSRTTCCSCWP